MVLVTCTAPPAPSCTGSITESCAAAEGSWKRWGVVSTSSSSSLPQVLQQHFQLQSHWCCVEMLLLIVLINPCSSLFHRAVLTAHCLTCATCVSLCEQQKEKFTYWMCIRTKKGAYGPFLILFFPQHEFPGAENNSNSCSHFFCTVCFIHTVVFHCIQVKLLGWNESG